MLWHWVVTTAAPWVAPQYAPYGKSQAFQRTVFFNRLQGVFRTRRSEAARRWDKRRYAFAVKLYGQAEQPHEYLSYPFRYASHYLSTLSANL